MHHFVGFAEDGAALYRDGCTDEVCAWPDYVGQVVDFSPVAEDDDHVSQYRDIVIARVGAPIQQGGPIQQPRASRVDAGPAHSPIQQPLIAQAPRGVLAPSPIAPGIQAPAAPTAPPEPWWAHYGELEGGHYIATPHPGATFEMEAFGSPEDLAAMQSGQETPEDLAYEQPAAEPFEPISRYAAPARGRFTGIMRAAGRFLTGQWAHGNAPTPKHKAMRTRQNQGKAQGQIPSSRRKTVSPDDPRLVSAECKEAIRQGYDSADQMYACWQPGYGGGGGGGGGGSYGGDYGEDYSEEEGSEEYPQEVPPGYMFVPGPPPGEEEEAGDDEPEEESVEFAGQAPAGLGSEIGGIAGGILGAFIGAPELGAPIGAGIGGAIQGAACQHGGAPGFGIQASAPSREVIHTKTFGSATLHGQTAFDGLFEPSPNEIGPIAEVVRQGNAILRRAGGSAQRGSRRTRVGQTTECFASEAREIFDDTPRFAAAGIWDDLGTLQDSIGRGFEDAANWTYDQGESLVHYAVGGGPGAKDFGPYSQATIQSILAGLRNAGYDIEGGNPYDVDVKQHGVKLAATVHPNGIVTIAIASSYFYVTHNQVWEKVDPLMPAAEVR